MLDGFVCSGSQKLGELIVLSFVAGSDDFVLYTCTAENSQGMVEKSLKLTGQ